ncbi:MAG TPA: reverse transcriptase family protein [Terriglobales bacterium]|nr:reverse transcriptase family protein [Terriglobales bacterium]
MRPDPRLPEALANAFLAGELTVDAVAARAAHVLGHNWRWLRPVARRYVETLAGRVRPRRADVVEFLLHDQEFYRAWQRLPSHLGIAHWITEPQQMQPVPTARAWQVPKIESVSALAEWLGMDVNYLEWFADLKSLGYRTDCTRLRHYYYRVLVKDSGNIRLIEAPKQALRSLQRRVLHGILDKVPAHSAAHGFVKGRSIKTFVAPHVKQRVVLRMDLRDFFPSFRAAQIEAFFRTMGYPERIADLLAGICTTATPRDVWRRIKPIGDPVLFWEIRTVYARPHLPQGAPTSPALANLCSFRLDCRLAGLAKAAGAHYTRYADDLAFSGDAGFEKTVERFSTHVAAIVMEQGFSVNHHKTRIMRRGVRQRLAGIVANEHANVTRKEFDRLKAILTNCIRHGPESQNREHHPDFRAHLEGRLCFVEMVNPTKAIRLRNIFNQIPWA